MAWISGIDQSQPGKVPEKHDSGNQNGLHRKAMIFHSLEKTSSDLNTGDLKIAGDLGGQLIELLVDTEACISVRKIYGSQPARITNGSFRPSRQSVEKKSQS